MLYEPKPFLRDDGSQLTAYLIDPACKVGPQVKELWKVDSNVFTPVCHMCCFRHSKHGCCYVSFNALQPCIYYNRNFGFTHFFQEQQQPHRADKRQRCSWLQQALTLPRRILSRLCPRKKARQ